MNLFFDDMSQKLIVDAKKEMFELKHPYVGSEHLLLAILSNQQLEITKLLNNYNINYKNFKDELIRVVGVGSKSNDWFLFTPLLKKIINNACYYSDDSKIITPYSLFVSILQEGDGVANRILIGMNIDLELISEQVLSLDTINKKCDFNFLNEYGINMNENIVDDNILIGREDYINKLMQTLLRKNKNNPLLIGDAGVGKTAIVEELAKLISLGKVPLKLKNKIIYSISMSNLVAGTKYRGEFEEKINNLVKELKDNPNIILFIDEIHTLMGAGGAEGAIDAANIVKPYLARGELCIIGATTTTEYDKYMAKDKALDRRFQKIYIEESKYDEVKNILLNLKDIYGNFHNVIITKEIIDLILNLSFECVFSGRQPDKAIDLLDEVCSFSSLKNNEYEKIINDYESQIKRIEVEKNNRIIQHNFKEASMLKEQELKVRSEYNNYLFLNSNNNPYKIKKCDVYSVIYNKNRIPTKEYIKKKVAELKRELRKEIYGQQDAVDSILKNITNYDYISINSSMTLLLIGKNGVGKTFLVDKVVNKLFKNNNIKINMGEYQDYQSLSKLIGSNPGYIGYNDEYLLEKIKYNPYYVIILDNIEKANKKIINFFYKSINNGYFYDSHNEKVMLTKCIFIMISTCNECSVGFVNTTNSKINSFNFTDVIYFNDISIDVISKYIDSNYNISNKEKQNIISKIDYNTSGFKNIDSVLSKYVLSKIKT